MARLVSFLSVLIAAAFALPADRPARVALFAEMMRAGVQKVEAHLAAPDPTPETREVANAGLATLALGEDPRRAERLVLWAFRHQILDSGSPVYGTIPWRVGHPEIRDPNAIEFCTQALGPLFLGYGDQLSPEFRQQMRPHLEASLAAVRRHNVPITYTNIFLMKATNLLLAGQAAGDARAVSEGEALLDQWIEYTRRAGIGEFDSPNYYTVDLMSLQMGNLYAARAETRQKYRRLLDFFWSDIAANFYPGRGTLSGPHSRTYQFLSGHESIGLFLYLEDLRHTPSAEKAGLGRIYLLISERKGGYRPPAEILSLASLPERVVRSRWRAGAGHQRYNYITPDFAIGSTSYHYTGHDKLINIELGRQSQTPVVYLAPDLTGHPYGRQKVARGPSGQTKPFHLPLNAAAVQEKGALLVLLDLDPSKEKESGSFCTNVVFPLAARILLDGRSVMLNNLTEVKAKADSVLGLRVDDAGLAVRFVALPRESRLLLKADEAGIGEGAGRFLIEHYRGASRHFDDSHVRVGLLFLAAKCRNEANLRKLMTKAAAAAIQSEQKAGLWRVRCRTGALELEVARQLDGGAIVEQLVNGVPVPGDVLSVNSIDLTRYLPPAGR
ncbi:MAG: hypothetical protein NTY38_26545 [Acidobacteria bacterium]|nr:hypothetical protein [Acidobacteriota bacterium]